MFFCVDTDVALEHAIFVSESFTFQSFSWFGQGCPFFPVLLDHLVLTIVRKSDPNNCSVKLDVNLRYED